MSNNEAPPTPNKSKSPSKKRKSRGIATSAPEASNTPNGSSSSANAQLPANPLVSNDRGVPAILPIVEGSSSGQSPTTPPPASIDVTSLGQCSPLAAATMGRVSCHVTVTSNSAITSLMQIGLGLGKGSTGVSDVPFPNARELRFVAVDAHGTMAGFRLEYQTVGDAEAAQRVATKGQTILITNVRSSVVREPNQKIVMPRSFHSSLARQAEISVAAQPLSTDKPCEEFAITYNPNCGGGGLDGAKSGLLCLITAVPAHNGFISLLCLVTAAARPHYENGHFSRDVTVMTDNGTTIGLSLMKHHAKLDLHQRSNNRRPILCIEGAMVNEAGCVIAMESTIVTCNDPEFWPAASRSALFSLLDTSADMDLQVVTSDADTLRDPAKVMRCHVPPPHPPRNGNERSRSQLRYLFSMQRRPWVGLSLAVCLCCQCAMVPNYNPTGDPLFLLSSCPLRLHPI